MFSGPVTDTIAIGETPVVIRKLPWRKLEEAKRAAQLDSASLVKAYGAEMIREIQRIGEAEVTAAVEQEKAARRAGASDSQYDTGTILRAGVLTVGGVKPTPEQIDDFDEDVAGTLKAAILALSRPSRTPEDEKNG